MLFRCTPHCVIVTATHAEGTAENRLACSARIAVHSCSSGARAHPEGTAAHSRSARRHMSDARTRNFRDRPTLAAMTPEQDHVTTQERSVRRILITGGAGFIGSHLCETLLADGHEVICADNFFTGSRRNVAHLLGNPRFEILRHDVCFPLYVEVDEIFNLACPASPVHYQHDPVQTVKTSVHGAINMLGLAKRLERAHLPGLDQRGLRQSGRASADRRATGDTSIRSDCARATTKASGARRRCSSTTTASTVSTSGSRASSTPTARACIPTTAGWCRTSSCRRCAASRSRCSAKAARRVRSATSTTSSRAIVAFMHADDAFPGPINLGNPDRGHGAQARRDRHPPDQIRRRRLVFKPLPSDDPERRRPDITLARERLGWEPTTQLEDGLRKVIAYFEATAVRPGIFTHEVLPHTTYTPDTRPSHGTVPLATQPAGPRRNDRPRGVCALRLRRAGRGRRQRGAHSACGPPPPSCWSRARRRASRWGPHLALLANFLPGYSVSWGRRDRRARLRLPDRRRAGVLIAIVWNLDPSRLPRARGHPPLLRRRPVAETPC